MRHVVCIGDSLTQGTVGRVDRAHGGHGCWVEQVGEALGDVIGPNLGSGFRGLWLGLSLPTSGEWRATGRWSTTAATDPFDVCPFGEGFVSEGGADSVLTWSTPPGAEIAGFDLYWVSIHDGGHWQYRVDDGPWRNVTQPAARADALHKFWVPGRVTNRVQVRAYDGDRASRVLIAGIAAYSHDAYERGVAVHNLGRGGAYLARFVREGRGDALAWLDGVTAAPAARAFTPSLATVMFSNDVALANVERWKRDLTVLLRRLRRWCAVLLINPPEKDVGSPAVQAQYRSATKVLADEHECALLDLYDEWAADGVVGWAAADACGLMHDRAHPSQRGHDDIASRVWRVLRATL